MEARPQTKTAFATSVRLESDLNSKLEALAVAMDRPKTWIIERAVQRYVEEQAWQIEAIREAYESYQDGTAKVIPHSEVVEQLEGRIEARLSQ
ncbi:MAG: ribbon-helix-helix protein, CopG family [Chloroflexota bacterium]